MSETSRLAPPSKDPRQLKNEGWFYGLALLLAGCLRFIQLGAAPLTDAEAESALQALRLADGLQPAIGSHSAYVLLTSAGFFLLGSSNFLARFFPALVGSALVLLPVLFRGPLKPRPALILAFFLALDPGLVAISRQAAGSILAITFLLAAWGCLRLDRPQWAGVFAALALLGGPAIWAGLLGLGITWAVHQRLEPRLGSSAPSAQAHRRPKPPRKASALAAPVGPAARISPEQLRPAVAYFFGTLLLIGVLFLTGANRLSSAFTSLVDYLRGWGMASGESPGRLLFALLVYQPLAILLAAIALVRGLLGGSRRVILLGLWLLITLLVALLYPSRQVSDLAWVLLPLCCLAALELAQHTRPASSDRREVAGTALLTSLILVFAWFDLAGLAWTAIPSGDATARFILLLGAALLLGISLFLVAAGWAPRIAGLGAIWGLVAALGLYTLASAAGAARLRGDLSPELWWPPGRPAQAHLLEATVADLSRTSTGQATGLPVVIAGLHAPSLEWALRFHGATVTEAVDIAAAPPLVVTPLRIDPLLAATYRGQDFAWQQEPLWDTALLPAWLRWITLRQMPASGEMIILWARDDLFLDGAAAVPGE